MSSGRVREKRPLDGFPVCSESVIDLVRCNLAAGTWKQWWCLKFSSGSFRIKLRDVCGAFNKQGSPSAFLINFYGPGCARTEPTVLLKEQNKEIPGGPHPDADERHPKVCGKLFSAACQVKIQHFIPMSFTLPKQETHSEKHIWNLSGTIPVVTFAAQKLDLAPALGSHPSKSTRPLKTTIVRMSDCSSPSALVTFKWIFGSCPHFWQIFAFFYYFIMFGSGSQLWPWSFLKLAERAIDFNHESHLML